MPNAVIEKSTGMYSLEVFSIFCHYWYSCYHLCSHTNYSQTWDYLMIEFVYLWLILNLFGWLWNAYMLCLFMY